MATTSQQKKEERQNSIVGLILLVLLAIAVFLLMPGMALIALVADTFSLRLDPVQMWAFSVFISLCAFVALRISAPDSSVAGRRYLILSGTLAALFILFFFGLKAPFAARWVVLFIPPSEPASQPSTASTQPSQTADTSTTPADESVEIPRAIPVSSPSAPLKPFLSSPPVPEARPVFYSVTGVARGDTLNVRRGPGANNAIAAKLPNGFNGIRVVGAPTMNGTTEWVHIEFTDGNGWVTSQYLQPE